MGAHIGEHICALLSIGHSKNSWTKASCAQTAAIPSVSLDLFFASKESVFFLFILCTTPSRQRAPAATVKCIASGGNRRSRDSVKKKEREEGWGTRDRLARCMRVFYR